ncbi:hypothetical protein OG990_04800 [Micromonospora sp. NBC_00858]|nr:hypothetical protein OG990_04800 [Micromonospora sp. NBC_00858]
MLRSARGRPGWPAPALALLAEYQDAPVSLFLYLAACLHDAIDDLHRLNPSVTGSAADMFDRFLGWPARHTRAYRVTIMKGTPAEEPSP